MLTLAIGVLLFAGCLAIGLKPLGEGLATARNEDVRLRVDANPNSSLLGPRVLIMEDCSGSSFVQSTARELLLQHHVPVYSAAFELVKPAHNTVYQAEPQLGMGHAIDKLANFSELRSEVLVFKAEQLYLTDEIVSVMKLHQARVVHVVRNNVLDRAVCEVRDCFNPRLGYPVDARGQRSHLCFDRRSQNDTTLEKAHLTDSVVRWMQWQKRRDSEVPGQIVEWGFPPALTLNEEDLSAFQYGVTKYNACDVSCSVRAWCRLLSSWGIDANPDIVSQYLSSSVSAGVADHDPPGPHRDTIANYEEVKARLAGTAFADELRD